MNRKEAEDFVYKSYLKAEKYQEYKAKDSEKRRPDLTEQIIKKRGGTPCVLVTGSKGKGSVANMISQILQTSYKVGLMTSPHIIDFCERFKVDGQNITDEEFVGCMDRVRPEIDEIDEHIPQNVCVSPMGIQATLGLEYFNQAHTDFNVMECGKGVKYDDVNNVTHQYAIINSIFLEHTRELGNTLEAIADDKSHIITGEQKCVYVAEQDKQALEVIQRRAEQFHTPVKCYGRDFKAEHIRFSNNGMIFDVRIADEYYTDIMVLLMGEHQAKNCALAMAFCRDILGGFEIERVKQKLAAMNWPGRMEVLSADPFIMLDACINEASCADIKKVLRNLKIDQATVIIGIPDDKDYLGVVRSVNEVAGAIILTKSQNPHYIFTPEQCVKAHEANIDTVWGESLEISINSAKSMHNPIVILGTTSVIAEVKRLQLETSIFS